MSPAHTTAAARERARALDREDPLAFTRNEFNIPTKAQIASTRLPDPESGPGDGDDNTAKCVYLCGNSLGLQPKRTRTRIDQYLATWATQGVQGHFKPLENSPLPTWLDVDARAAKLMAPIVGASESEVAVMQTLTANLHFLMSAFYRPDINGRHKIILERKAFPSDHFAVETQVRHHGLDPATSMVTIESQISKDNVLSTYEILSVISEHASSTALLLLPGIQYYTGQLLDIPVITAFAHKHGIFVIWDLAHAVGNVPLSLHDWDVDAAAWCSYKYLNGGPGCIGGLFVHERNSPATITTTTTTTTGDGNGNNNGGDYPHRLAGWWGNDKATRFAMDTSAGFRPVRGAAGFQLSNPSVLDITALGASLEVFAEAGGVARLRDKSLRLTGFLEELLLELLQQQQQQQQQGKEGDDKQLFRIITPSDPQQRGAQLSLLLQGEASGMLDTVMRELEARGVVVDERRPDVIRVAPAPLYNTFEDCVDFVEAFSAALEVVRREKRT